MPRSRPKVVAHSTPEEDPRPKFWPRVLGSMALFGFMVGMMIGRVTAPDPAQLQRVEAIEGGLALWFDHKAEVQAQSPDGVYTLQLDAQGPTGQGRVQLDGRPARWRVQRDRQKLVLSVLATRPLQGEWAWHKEKDAWKLSVSLQAPE